MQVSTRVPLAHAPVAVELRTVAAFQGGRSFLESLVHRQKCRVSWKRGHQRRARSLETLPVPSSD